MISTIETIYRCDIDFDCGDNGDTDKVLEAAERFHTTARGVVDKWGLPGLAVADISLYSTPCCCYIRIEGEDKNIVQEIAAKTERYILRFKGSKII